MKSEAEIRKDYVDADSNKEYRYRIVRDEWIKERSMVEAMGISIKVILSPSIQDLLGEPKRINGHIYYKGPNVENVAETFFNARINGKYIESMVL